MISSDLLFNIATTLLVNDKNPEIIRQLLDLAYRVRELEHEERLPVDPKPSVRDVMMKEYIDTMNDMSKDLGPNPWHKEDKKYEQTDPAGRAEEVLEEDSEKWAKEFLTAPTDTPMHKAEELRKQFTDKKLNERWNKKTNEAAKKRHDEWVNRKK